MNKYTVEVIPIHEKNEDASYCVREKDQNGRSEFIENIRGGSLIFSSKHTAWDFAISYSNVNSEIYKGIREYECKLLITVNILKDNFSSVLTTRFNQDNIKFDTKGIAEYLGVDEDEIYYKYTLENKTTGSEWIYNPKITQFTSPTGLRLLPPIYLKFGYLHVVRCPKGTYLETQ